MKIVFFEVQEWEKDILSKQYPDALYTSDTVTAEMANLYADAEIISTFIYSDCSASVLSRLPNLKIIATRSTGYDHIDLAYCKEHGIIVCSVPEYGSRTVAEYTFALLLTVSRRMHDGIEQSKKCDFDHTKIQGIDLFGKTLGVIGLGKIGVEVVKIANGFGMKVLVNARKVDKTLSDALGFTYTSLEELLKQSDVITLHLPDVESTHHTINTNNIMFCKPGTILINTARGGLIQTEAILLGLERNILRGVGIDVLEEEKDLSEEAEIIAAHPKHSMDFKTLCIDHVLIHHPKVVVTPHNAFNSHEALVRIVQTTMENIEAFTKGQPINTVSS